MDIALSPRVQEMRRHLEQLLIEAPDKQGKSVVQIKQAHTRHAFYAKSNKNGGGAPTAAAMSDMRDQLVRTWADARNRPVKVEVATHCGKFVHTANTSTDVLVDPAALFKLTQGLDNFRYLGTHCLEKADWPRDVNTAAMFLPLGVYLTSRPSAASTAPVYELAQSKNEDFLSALHDDPEVAQAAADYLAGCVAPRKGLSADRYAKQILFLTNTPSRDAPDTLLLMPTHPAALAHRMWELVDAAKAWRLDPNRDPEIPVLDYRVVETQVGGSKPQNVSFLNNARNGRNYSLLALPPALRVDSNMQIARSTCAISLFLRYPETREHLSLVAQGLKKYQNGTATTAVRDMVQVQAEELVDLFANFTLSVRAGDLYMFAPDKSRLPAAQRIWFSGHVTTAVEADDATQRVQRDFIDKVLGQLHKQGALAAAGYAARLSELLVNWGLTPEVTAHG